MQYDGKLMQQMVVMPRGVDWKSKHKSENFLNECMAGIQGDNIWLRLRATYKGHTEKPQYYVVPNFRGKRLCDIEREIDEMYGDGECYPLGQNLHDCLCDMCDYGLSASMMAHGFFG